MTWRSLVGGVALLGLGALLVGVARVWMASWVRGLGFRRCRLFGSASPATEEDPILHQLSDSVELHVQLREALFAAPETSLQPGGALRCSCSGTATLDKSPPQSVGHSNIGTIF